MKHLFIIIPLFFLFFCCSAQSNGTDKWSPVVIDKQTLKPVSNATLAVNRKDYYPVSEEGKGEIPFVGINRGDTLYVSSLGYKTLKLSVIDKYQLPQRLELEPMTYELAEVVVKKEGLAATEEMVGANPSAKKSNLFVSTKTKYVQFINNNAKRSGYIKEVLIRMHNLARAIKMPFRLRLYDRKPGDRYPGNELMDEMIVRNEQGKEWFVIDLSKFAIKLPENGFFVVFETLPAAYYSNKLLSVGPWPQGRLPGICTTLKKTDMNTDNYSMERTNFPDWQNVSNAYEFQIRAKLLLVN